MTTALLIIDVQRAILTGLAGAERQAAIDAMLDEVAARLGSLKRDAEAAGVPVISVQHDGVSGHRLEVGTLRWQFRNEIAPISDSIIAHKRHCDSFYGTDLAEVAAERGITHLIIGGCMTQFCVDTTVRRAVSSGFDVTLLQNGHTTSDFGQLSAEEIIEHHNRLLSGHDTGPTIARVKPISAVLFSKGNGDDRMVKDAHWKPGSD